MPIGIEVVPLNEQNTESFWVGAERPPYEADRVEANLVNGFKAWLEERGYAVSRLRIVPKGEVTTEFAGLLPHAHSSSAAAE